MKKALPCSECQLVSRRNSGIWKSPFGNYHSKFQCVFLPAIYWLQREKGYFIMRNPSRYQLKAVMGQINYVILLRHTEDTASLLWHSCPKMCNLNLIMEISDDQTEGHCRKLSQGNNVKVKKQQPTTTKSAPKWLTCYSRVLKRLNNW